jgi:hypothetical protein
MTNHKLYIEASFNSIPDTNYEVWVLRTFMQEICMMVSIGILLVPKE